MSSQADVLTKKVGDQVDRVKKDRDFNRAAASVVRIAAILLSSTVTVILGVKGYADESYSTILSVIGLIASAALTALTAWESFADYGGRWIRKRATLSALHGVQDDLQYSLAADAQLSLDELTAFHDRLNACLQEEQTLWASQRAKSIVAPLAAYGSK